MRQHLRLTQLFGRRSLRSASLSAIKRQGEHSQLRKSTSHNGSCSVNDLRAQPTSCTTLAGYDTVSGFGVNKVERLMNVEEVTVVLNQHSWNDSWPFQTLGWD